MNPMNPMNPMTDGRYFSAPLGTVTTGRLELSGGASNLNLRLLAPAANLPRERQSLLEALFEGTPPEVGIADGDVRLTYRHRFRLFDRGTTGAEIALHPAVPWNVVLRGGLSRVNADFGRLPIERLDIDGGVSDFQLVLPKPAGTLKMQVRGGVIGALVTCPAGVPLRVSITGGATHLHVDRLVLGAIGSGFEWESTDFATSTDRIELEIVGGAHELTVRGPDAPRTSPEPGASLGASP